MKKIAIIVQRFGRNILGGSEGYAFNMAMVLKDFFQVDVLTSTAKDHLTWQPFYREGIHAEDGVRVLRFDPDFQRSSYWHELHSTMLGRITLRAFSDLEGESRDHFIDRLKRIPLGLAEEFIRLMGPYPSGLLNHLRLNSREYDHILFMTYLYPSTYFGIDQVSEKEKILICPTFHDEPYAYLPNFRKYLDCNFLFLSGPEKELAEKVFGTAIHNSHVIGFGLKDHYTDIAGEENPNQYILYAGRLDEAKGVGKLIEFWQKFIKKSSNHELELRLIGDGPLKKHANGNRTIFLGYVSEKDKLSLMRDAMAFVHPSPYESLGIVLLESFMMGTPALVNSRSDVLKSHLTASGAGFSYSNYDEFESALRRMREDREMLERQGMAARDYYSKNYTFEAYREKLLSVISPA